MKKVFISLLSTVVCFMACDPDWALDPKNQGQAFIVNESDNEITFRAYTLNTGSLHTEYTIPPGDTVKVSSTAWDERSSNWEEISAAGWDPFLATVALRSYDVRIDKFNNLHHMISIITSPDDSTSWILDVDNIEKYSIFNEDNWEKKELSDDNHTHIDWYYSHKDIPVKE